MLNHDVWPKSKQCPPIPESSPIVIERVGLMKFSSRMDVLVPGEAEVLVRKGERVTGGVTVIARVR